MKQLWSETIGPILFGLVLIGTPIFILIKIVNWINKNNRKNALVNNEPAPPKKSLLGLLFDGILKCLFLGVLFGSNDNDSNSSSSN